MTTTLPELPPTQLRDTAAARRLFRAALEPELAAGLPALRLLPPTCVDEGPLSAQQRLVRAWASRQTQRFGALRLDDAPYADVVLRRTVGACAPLLRMSGAWLQWLSSPANGDTEASLRCLTLYAADLGVGGPHCTRGDALEQLLREVGLGRLTHPARMATAREIPDAAFAAIGPLLAVSRRPEECVGEILGADLLLRTIGLLPPLAALHSRLPATVRVTDLDFGAARNAHAQSSLDLAQRCVEAQPERTQPAMAAGFAWAFATVQAWSEWLLADLTAAADPGYEMAELLGRRAPEAAHYHDRFTLDGKPLRDWFRTLDHPALLVSKLAESSLIRPGDPDTSPLLRGLISPNGPMFRIFTADDESVIRRWITALPARSADQPDRRAPVLATLDIAVTATPPGPQRPPDLRSAYHLLLNRDDSPALRQYALDYVTDWLTRAGKDWADTPALPPAEWTPGCTRTWVLAQHEQHARDFTTHTREEHPPRDELVEGTVQLAPLTLIDGSWLQGFTDYLHAGTDLGHFLFEIYWDELGNGDPALNHPTLYREVLREMGVDLPPTGSAEFASWPGFQDRSFELPVFWLSIGRLPDTFLPEILGLNLAMELSGVGGTYRRAHAALKHHGFSTRFVDIHNTIDNVATGHTAWAADAVDTYMEHTLALVGGDSTNRLWRRVRTGYRALNPPEPSRASWITKRMKSALTEWI